MLFIRLMDKIQFFLGSCNNHDVFLDVKFLKTSKNIFCCVYKLLLYLKTKLLYSIFV